MVVNVPFSGRRLRLAVIFASAALLVPLLSVASPAASPELVVQTTAGAVQGVLDGATKEWRGVPYAEPPVGALRWQRTVPFGPWAGVRDATTFAEPCIQLADPTTTRGSEDCLYLNVFAPASAASSARLPVMVHLHPGGNAVGGAYQDATAFTSRGVVVVTVGYRLGVLGFAGHPQLSVEGGGASGEYGLFDQLTALEWVRDNVAGFGGDPDRVTLFGSSAGSFDTVALMASPLGQGLMSAAAVQAEPWRGLTGVNNEISDAEDFGVYVAGKVGCGTTGDTAACLRALPADDLVKAGGFLDIVPWVGGDVLPEPPRQLLRDGVGNFPLLIGHNREDAAGFNFPFPDPYSQGAWVKDTNFVVGSPYGTQARALYPPAEYGSRWWSYITMTTDAEKGCPTREVANTVSARAPVWRFLYTHTYQQGDPFWTDMRASHHFEEPLLWHEDLTEFGLTLSPAEQELSSQMTDYWTNFAKTGDPNAAGLPPWPRYTQASQPTLVLDTPSGVVSQFHKTHCAFLDTVPVLFPYPWEAGHGSAAGDALPLFPPGWTFPAPPTETPPL